MKYIPKKQDIKTVSGRRNHHFIACWPFSFSHSSRVAVHLYCMVLLSGPNLAWFQRLSLFPFSFNCKRRSQVASEAERTKKTSGIRVALGQFMFRIRRKISIHQMRSSSFYDRVFVHGMPRNVVPSKTSNLSCWNSFQTMSKLREFSKYTWVRHLFVSYRRIGRYTLFLLSLPNQNKSLDKEHLGYTGPQSIHRPVSLSYAILNSWLGRCSL